MQKKKLVIGLFGFGCVGKGLYDVINRGNETGQVAFIKKIVAKDPLKKRNISPAHLSFLKEDILNDDEINVVVELIDDADAAFDIVSAAMRNGKAVVSANKKMIAENFDELYRLQKEFNVPFLYEAACCASLPLIRNLEEYYDTDTLQSIEGIVNGSTNYILTKTCAENISFNKALETAQSLGYAESDPTLDICGFDAAFKLSILLIHAFGIYIKKAAIFTSGIHRITEADNAYAFARGMKIKLIAGAFIQEDGSLCFFVLPKFIPRDHILYHVDDVFNGVIMKTTFADTHFFSGRGAGALPTASAVLSDISALGYDYKYAYKKLTGNRRKKTSTNFFLKVLVSFPVEKAAIVQPFFTSIQETFTNPESGYFTGTIHFENLQRLKEMDDTISIILMDVCDTGVAKQNKFEEAEVEESALSKPDKLTPEKEVRYLKIFGNKVDTKEGKTFVMFTKKQPPPAARLGD